MIMNWLRNWKTQSVLVFGPLVGLVWAAGPSLGLGSVAARLGWLLLLLVLWASFLLVAPIRKLRTAAAMAAPPGNPAPGPALAAPRDPAGVAELRRRMRGALDLLEASHLGSTRGRAARYALPWYLVLGAAGCGKTSAIHNAGLRITRSPQADPLARAAEPTLDCDWIFATGGVLLDTPGRYASQGEDLPEWQELLKLLKTHRPKAPVNGVLLTVSLWDLTRPRTPAFAAQAGLLRRRLGEMERAFRMKIPVYLVVTKMDQLSGFGPFFQGRPEAERNQVWGAALAPGHAARDMGGRFDQLCQGLAQRATDRLTRDPGSRESALAAFPLEFRALREALLAFVELLVEEDPYHPRPWIRGFYFTCAMQGETAGVGDRDRIAARFGLLPVPERPAAAGPPCFLEGLFNEAVFPDRDLVRHGADQGGNRTSRAAMAAGLAGLSLLAGGWSWSYTGNRKLIREAREEAREAWLLYGSQSLEDRMRALQVLQFRLEHLDRYRRQGRPLALGWGLYQGGRVAGILRAHYLAGLAETMLQPVRQELEEDLAKAPEPNLEQDYNTLKTYLMLAHPERMDMAHLTDQIPRFWRPCLQAQAIDGSEAALFRMAERTVAFYAAQIREPDLPVIANRPDLVARARARLRGQIRNLTPLEQIYTEMKTRANTRFEPMTLSRILNGRDPDLLTGSCFIQGSLTREAWEGYFREAFQEASRGGFQGTDWVLDSPLEGPLEAQGSPETGRARLEELYKADFAREWSRFLQGLAVRAFTGPGDAAAALARLADPQGSPLRLVVAQTAYQTAWDNPSELKKSLHAARNRVIEQTERLLGGHGGPEAESRDRPGQLGGQFAAAAALADPGDGGHAALDAYLGLLRKIRGRMLAIGNAGDPGQEARQCLQATLAGASELAEGQQWVDTALPGPGNEEGRANLRPLLLRPLIQAYAALLPEAEQDLNRAWTQQVYNTWSNLATKYPFADTGNEAQMADILKFLKPGDGLLPRFLDKHLGGLLVRRGETFVPRTWGGLSLPFGPGFLRGISRLRAAAEALEEGDPSRFELQPVPTPGLSEICLELDGQKLQYRNGPQAWTGFSWPNPAAPVQGARIQSVEFQGATAEVQNAPGRLGLMRLLDQCRVENRLAPTSSLEWKLKPSRASPTRDAAPDGRRIRFNFRMVSGPNPLRLGALRQHALPAKISR
jgi:type VI secretion system protein ImpL